MVNVLLWSEGAFDVIKKLANQACAQIKRAFQIFREHFFVALELRGYVPHVHFILGVIFDLLCVATQKDFSGGEKSFHRAF